MFVKELLDFNGVDVFTSADNDVFNSPNYLQKVVVVENSDVATVRRKTCFKISLSSNNYYRVRNTVRTDYPRKKFVSGVFLKN